MKKIAVVLMFLSACAVETEVGPQGPVGPAGAEGPAGYSPLASGTRIKARVGTTADGAKMFLGWFDAERGVDCEFLKAADGQTRCLPVGPSVQAGKLFSDSACTTPVIRWEPEGSEPRPEFARSSSDDSLSARAWKLLEAAEPPAFGIWPDGSCSAYEPSIQDGWFAADDITQQQPALSVSVE